MHKLKLRLHYYKVLQSFNLPFSLLASSTGFIFQEHVAARIINAFSLSLLTGGFLIALYLFEDRYSGQYFFYHNLGLSKINLIVSSFLFNVGLVILLWFVKVYLYA
ncbi:hypothetical protein [Pontibacter sp. H249]|uniref:hypothetical protein n=1 Tax=Pontibacter sp. H249 TaxID=3133420 RepID=UPI0030BE8372